MSQASENVELDIAAVFGAEDDVSGQSFSIYVPNKDKHGKEI